MSGWLQIHRGEAPLVVAFPHTGTDLPAEFAGGFASPWIARCDADWHIEKLYGFAANLGATTIRTAVSRSIIDVNRDPSGASLYPGMTTTELCPTTTFDGDALYRLGAAPDETEISARRDRYFTPYHEALGAEINRLRAMHGAVVLYDAHAIRSRIPRLFEGELPNFNIGTNTGAACAPALAERVVEICASAPGFSHVRDGRFKGGYTTRFWGRPDVGVHAIQMELAFRTFLDEPAAVNDQRWPAAYDSGRAAAARAVLTRVLESCLAFAKESPPR